VELVSRNFYSVLGVRPQLERAIQTSDDVASGAVAVAVISDSLWRRQFGRSPTVPGQMIAVNQTSSIESQRVLGERTIPKALIEPVRIVLKTGFRGDCDFATRVSKAGRGNERVWKAWKAKKPAFHPSHTPWKSLRDYHIPTASTTGIFQSARA
jgi:hypothetical protein